MTFQQKQKKYWKCFIYFDHSLHSFVELATWITNDVFNKHFTLMHCTQNSLVRQMLSRWEHTVEHGAQEKNTAIAWNSNREMIFHAQKHWRCSISVDWARWMLVVGRTKAFYAIAQCVCCFFSPFFFRFFVSFPLFRFFFYGVVSAKDALDDRVFVEALYSGLGIMRIELRSRWWFLFSVSLYDIKIHLTIWKLLSRESWRMKIKSFLFLHVSEKSRCLHERFLCVQHLMHLCINTAQHGLDYVSCELNCGIQWIEIGVFFKKIHKTQHFHSS